VAISEAIIRQQIVQVQWSDTVQTVCDQVRALYPDTPLQAYIWLQHPSEGYAIASMSDLNQRAWTEGRRILQMPVSEFPDLFPLQSGVERDGPVSESGAFRQARNYDGRLIVLHQGQVIGFVANETRGRSTPPRGAFRLFDPPIPPERFERDPFFVATYDTSVAAAMDRLQRVQGRIQPFVMFPDPYAKDQWFVFGEKDLQQAMQTHDEIRGWALAQLSEVPYRKCQAVTYEEVGEKQAEELCVDTRCLVIIHENQPKLMVPDLVFRSATLAPGPTARGPAPPTTVPVPPGSRYVNLWFEGRPKERPLVLGQSYRLLVNIGAHDAKRSIVAWEKEVRPPPIIEPPETKEQKEARFYVSVFSADFEVEEPTKILTLPPRGHSKDIEFQVRPLRRTFSAEDLAALDVCLYYRCNLVQSFEIKAEVLAEGEEKRTKDPQRAVLKAARVEEYPDLDQVTAKDLNLTITKRADGKYQFTFTLAPEAVEAPRWDEIRLGCHVDLTRDELTHLITKARRMLYNVVEVYDAVVEDRPQARDKALHALAQVGRQLYLKLFQNESARLLAEEWMPQNLPPGSTIQIVDRAKDFVFPWSLIYLASPWDDEIPIDIEQFWGWRYKLAIATEQLTQTYGEVGEEIEADEGLKVFFGFYKGLTGARAQKSYFDQLGTVPVQNRREAVAALQEADQHLIYFFCHGYTEKMIHDIQLDDDLVREFIQLSADRKETDQSLTDHLDDLFDVSDSWMRLTWSKLPLTMLHEELEGISFHHHPLVFLNMCQSAQVLPSLSGGLIPFFIDKGARGVIGTECSMNMTFGDRFSRDFLDRFRDGIPAAEILWQLRQESLSKGDPLALAYTLFGDADLRLKKIQE
jgi:hypothetical protein